MKRMVSLVAAATALGVLVGGALAAAGSAAPALPTLTLGLEGGKSITVGGTLQSGAVNIVSTVTGEPQGNPALIRLDPGVSFAQAAAAVTSHQGDFNYLDPYGALVFGSTVNGGASSSAQVALVAGHYVALDLTGTGKPVFKLFTVTQAASPAALPAPQATVASIEFAFRGPSTLRDGELVRFENQGFLVHMIVAAGVKNGGDAKKLSALLTAGKTNAAMKLATSFPTFDGGLSSGQMQQEVITEPPGIYVLACFMNTQDGREHTQLGMVRTIRIVK